MTEAEWLTSGDPYEVLRHAFQDSDPEEFKNRKAILFVAACCSHIQMSSRSRVEKEAIEWLFAKADGDTEKREKRAMLWSLERASQRRVNERDALMAIHTSVSETRVSNFYAAAFLAAKRISQALAQGDKALEEKEDRIHCGFIRCILGNPFRPVTFAPEWQTTTVVLLAQSIYESRDFSPMAILADALQDAGCDNAEILDHCRGPGPHVRGCWVVDSLLGKA